MALVTIQVIEGLERGRVFADLLTPVTIGREDDNLVQLNDERVSRFHAKLQEDGDQVILTDLDSTNGTRVNGHPVQMRVLQIGDQLTIGRCLLLFGSREQIEPDSRTVPSLRNLTMPVVDGSVDAGSEDLDDEAVSELDQESGELFPNGPPTPPEQLRPVQQAQLSDMIAYAHERIREVLKAAREHDKRGEMQMIVDHDDWKRLLALEMDLAVYLRKLADPD